MKTQSQLPASLQPACADAATTVAILAHQDAQKSQEQARASRRSHQQDHVSELKQAAGKLRQMAQRSLGSGIYQGLLGLGSAALSLKGSFCEVEQTAGRWQAGARLLEAGARVDPFAIDRDFLAADKGQIEAEAARESALAQEAGDAASTHQRLQSSMVQQLQKIIDAQSAAISAAIKL